jgi:predicted naringenin-chalcone synthase
LDPEQQVINMLLADGAVRMDLGHEGQQAVFEVMGSFEYLLPNSLELMTWRPGSRNFEMTLSSEVPKQIERVIHQHVQRFLHGCGLRLDDIAQWAIHPGGLKIIESVAKALGVGEAKIRASQAVYRSRGNMSSTTVPHIWLAMLEGEGALQSGDFVASLAFGPGLTMVGNLLRRC